ncbi:MAG: hypothetical protein MR884_04555 [Clostridiales bacterium]|nr:hypothetical protein [Clostridiales bacterium]
MKIKSIVYKSSTGHTGRYARLLSEITGIPAYTSREAMINLKRGDDILFMGWIRIKDLMGYNLFLNLYNVKAIAAVGAVAPEFEDMILTKIRMKYRLSDRIKTFYLQGGYTPKMSRGMDQKLSGALIDDLGKKIRKKQKKGIDTLEYEKNLLNVLVNGGDFVSEKNLKDIVDWISKAGDTGEMEDRNEF